MLREVEKHATSASGDHEGELGSLSAVFLFEWCTIKARIYDYAFFLAPNLIATLPQLFREVEKHATSASGDPEGELGSLNAVFLFLWCTVRVLIYDNTFFRYMPTHFMYQH